MDGRRVATLRDGQSFGELALMYFAPRAATIRAVADTVLWVMDRVTFRALLVGSGSSKREQHKVRRPPSWPRRRADFSLLSLYFDRVAWAHLCLLGQPNTFLEQALYAE